MISLGLLTGIFSFLSFYFLNQGAVLGSLGSIWPIIIAFSFFIIFFVLEVILIDDIGILYIFIFFQSLLPFFALTKSFDNVRFLLVNFAILFIFTFWAAKKGHSLVKNGLKINFFSIAHRVVPKFFTGLLLVIMILLYFNYVFLGRFNDNMGRQTFNQVANFVAPAFEIWLPGVSLDLSIREALEESARVQLQKSKIDLLEKGINLDEMSSSQKEELVKQTTLQIEENIEEVVGELDYDQTVREFAYGTIKNRVDELSPTAKIFTGGGVFLILFFLIKGIAFILYPIIEFIAFVIYHLLLMTGFAHINLESRQKEIINIS
jgi:hypothetical protein